MKRKLSVDLVNLILEGEEKARPRYLTAKIIGVSVETINSWIKKGKKLLENTEDEYLFNLSSKDEGSLLGYLAREISKRQALGQADSYDAFMKTGKKEHIRNFLIKEGIAKNPDNAIEIITAGINIFETKDSINTKNENKPILMSPEDFSNYKL